MSEVILYTKYRTPVAFTLYANNATKITYLKMALGHIYMAFTCNFQMHIHHWINGLRSVTTPSNINVNSQSPLKRLGASPGNQICCNNLGNGICKSNFILKLNFSPVVIYGVWRHTLLLKKWIGQKKKNKSVSCSRSENCNAECGCFFFFFFFFFYNSWKSNAQCGFYFFKQNFRKKIHQNNSLGFFSTFIKNITSFISKWFMWPFILHALGASLMNFLPWPKLHHIWKKIQSKCTVHVE